VPKMPAMMLSYLLPIIDLSILADTIEAGIHTVQ
jgi:hypothetical protein